MKRKSCLHCGEEAHHRFCSVQCHHDYDWDQRYAAILKAKEVPARGRSGTARRFMFRYQGCFCKICSRKKWMGQTIPLILDHIDGNADNWKIKNLRLICPNCDAQTPTYKSKNIGNGRHARRQRYAEGKSY